MTCFLGDRVSPPNIILSVSVPAFGFGERIDRGRTYEADGISHSTDGSDSVQFLKHRETLLHFEPCSKVLHPLNKGREVESQSGGSKGQSGH
jgi:hypothetical protein